uniref:Uncharacterized protein n=1 Tax=Chromera velia CCMP2878 TaxID=1169474 RepID=A0A0G4IFF9_9ALVE|mmetsp:Transcript_23683/g.46529  ORF Transcript_23683/g.46529 Transcript_23683/m.46529 type:complete len:143 (+) Transcript_23683:250-678(+)|eukprot:Cvel_13967.t1-p1 / transcript=Cvel_13967.t1 / gene=Cvel_13967 / organism=Chromera_velia_CCMP2878 / gene_product=hypothetical protein / transcript_product=hypothetical protein / location=Cvel_scaffold976:14163-15987(+) / protein_length=142 / sequence_SO=supercontig / SO=protein_coding / is_pseudo=false
MSFEDGATELPSVLTKKRAAPHEAPKERDVYLTRRKKLAVYFRRINELLKSREFPEVHVHALGSCISTALYLVQDLSCHWPDLAVDVETRTVQVVDDRVELGGEAEEGEEAGDRIPRVSSTVRNVSGISIRLRRGKVLLNKK